MNEAEASVTIRATARQCFDYVADPSNVPRFMAGIQRNEPLTSKTRGKGARVLSVAEVAGKEIEAELEVTTWREPDRIVLNSVRGAKIRGTWTFQEFDDGSTDVTLLHEYELPGVFRFLPGGMVRGTIEKGLEDSLRRLKRQVEAAQKPGRRGSKARK